VRGVDADVLRHPLHGRVCAPLMRADVLRSGGLLPSAAMAKQAGAGPAAEQAAVRGATGRSFARPTAPGAPPSLRQAARAAAAPQVITAEKSRRTVEYAFGFAFLNNRRKVTAIHKANIMKLSDGLFLKVRAARAAPPAPSPRAPFERRAVCPAGRAAPLRTATPAGSCRPGRQHACAGVGRTCHISSHGC